MTVPEPLKKCCAERKIHFSNGSRRSLRSLTPSVKFLLRKNQSASPTVLPVLFFETDCAFIMCEPVGAPGRIRTCVAFRRWIYSPLQLTALPPTQWVKYTILKGIFTVNKLILLLYKATWYNAYMSQDHLIKMKCTQTGDISYVTRKNGKQNPEPLELKKYNKKTKKHTVYKETKT